MTASDFTNLHLQYKSAQADGEVPAVIEHDFPGGRMVDHYFVTPSPAFWADEGVQSLDGVSGILFLQQPDGAQWKILVHEQSMIKEVVFDFPEEEFRKMLADNGVTLPGEPALPPSPTEISPGCENFHIRGIFLCFSIDKVYIRMYHMNKRTYEGMMTVSENEKTGEKLPETAQLGVADIRRLQDDLPNDEVLYDLAELFRVFGDSTRIKILYALFESELCVNDIAQVVGISQSAVSHQLRLLKTSKLVKFRREGKAMYYSLDDDHVRSMIALGMEHTEE